MPRVRLDSLLAERGLFASRSRAAAAVLAGDVLLGAGRRRAEKPGQLVDALGLTDRLVHPSPARPQLLIGAAEPPKHLLRGYTSVTAAITPRDGDPNKLVGLGVLVVGERAQDLGGHVRRVDRDLGLD